MKKFFFSQNRLEVRTCGETYKKHSIVVQLFCDLMQALVSPDLQIIDGFISDADTSILGSNIECTMNSWGAYCLVLSVPSNMFISILHRDVDKWPVTKHWFGCLPEGAEIAWWFEILAPYDIFWSKIPAMLVYINCPFKSRSCMRDEKQQNYFILADFCVKTKPLKKHTKPGSI